MEIIKATSNNQNKDHGLSSHCLEIETLVSDQAKYDFCRRGMESLADPTELCHDTSQAAVGDMCEATAASVWPWLS